MTTELWALLGTALSIGFFHTLFGPDHYLPFVMLSWSRKWSAAKTALITFICGLGHVLSSVVLGFVGIAIGIAVEKLEIFEGNRGSVAAWLLIGFGLAYTIWGIRQAILNKPHSHKHLHIEDDQPHEHEHTHIDQHAHVHTEKKSITPWALFIIFVFGPCEPLIPMLMYPAAKDNTFGVIMVASVFGITTLATMMTAVFAIRAGLSLKFMNKAERYMHAIAGFTIFSCGMAIQFLGL